MEQKESILSAVRKLCTPGGNGIEIIDVTGCGDAFRAGYLYGVINQFDTRTRAELGCIMAMLNLQTPHTQNYRTDLKQVMELKEHYYGQH